MKSRKKELQEQAKGIDGYKDSLNIAELEALIGTAASVDLSSAGPVEEIEVNDQEDVVEVPAPVEKKVFQGGIDVTLLDQSAIDAIAYYHNNGVGGKERLEAIIRKCVIAD
jgi:hypothetical protein